MERVWGVQEEEEGSAELVLDFPSAFRFNLLFWLISGWRGIRHALTTAFDARRFLAIQCKTLLTRTPSFKLVIAFESIVQASSLAFGTLNLTKINSRIIRTNRRFRCFLSLPHSSITLRRRGPQRHFRIWSNWAKSLSPEEVIPDDNEIRRDDLAVRVVWQSRASA